MPTNQLTAGRRPGYALSLGRWEEAGEWLGAVAEWIDQTGWHDRDAAPSSATASKLGIRSRAQLIRRLAVEAG